MIKPPKIEGNEIIFYTSSGEFKRMLNKVTIENILKSDFDYFFKDEKMKKHLFGDYPIRYLPGKDKPDRGTIVLLYKNFPVESPADISDPRIYDDISSKVKDIKKDWLAKKLEMVKKGLKK